MDARMQKRRMARWLGRLFVGLSFVTPWVAQAAMVTVPLTYEYSQGGRTLFTTTVTSTDVASCREGAMLRCEMENECWSDGAYEIWHFSFAGGHGAGNCYYSGEVNSEAIMYATIRWRCALEGYWVLGYNLENMTCLLNVPDNNLTITLSGGTEIEPSNGSNTKTLPITATVIDQNTNQPPANPVQVRVSLKVDPTSGGHDHGDSARPRGGIADVEKCESDGECWMNPTVNGVLEFNFKAPEASGKHTITATCDGCSNTATKPVDVKVDGLKPIPAFPFYALNEVNGDVIGAKTGWHTDNHNLTPAAAAVLMKIAVTYRFNPRFYLRDPASNGQISFPPILHLNDASLPWGGVYDICARPNACLKRGIIVWKAPHIGHRRGTVVDVRANGTDGSIPTSNKIKFINLLVERGIPYLWEDRKTSNEHFHLMLLGVQE